MRILHTSDWHLGLSLGGLGLGPDHDLFLQWLRGALRDHAVDALVVAGDVFDTMQPSAEAQARYFRFLADVAETGVQQVVIVGGNHDSPSRLDAPAEVLAALKVLPAALFTPTVVALLVAFPLLILLEGIVAVME